MRLLYLTDNNSGHNRRFLEKLAASGHEVHYLSLAGVDLVSNWLPAGVLAIVPSRTFPRNSAPGAVLSFLPELQSILERVKPDLVHAGPVQNCAYLAAMTNFHPLLVMSWGSDILVDADRNNEWSDATRVALAGADGFFCDCDTVRKRAQQIVPIPDSQIVQLPWGIKQGIFYPEPEHVPPSDGAFTFICTRSWEPIYGMDVLLRAFHKAAQQESSLRLLLIGYGTGEREIRDYVKLHSLENRVVMPGAVSSADIPRHFRTANAYISCAESDGTSVSLLEAMATGLPVIVADNPSNREWVQEGAHGWLCTIRSADSFTEKILAAVRQPAPDRRHMSELNQQVVRERADWDRNFPLLLRAYERLCPSASERIL